MKRFDLRTAAAPSALLGPLTFLLALAPGEASAFSTESSVGDGCHEAMTVAAIKTAGWPGGEVAPELSETDRRILDDAAFGVTGDIYDPWSIAMLLGNRHVDLRSHERSDFVALSIEAARPARQPEHCLRMPGHDGEQGDVAAIEACRDFIMEQVGLAIGTANTIDLSIRETHEVVLDFGGPYEVAFPRYAFRMGMALHAVQDGFSHMLRTEDGMRVVHVMNYTEFVDESYDYSEARDGLVHQSHLDECGEGIPQHQQQRVDHAAQASAELLAAVNDPSGGREGRLARASEVLDRWFGYEAGCTVDNSYCNSAALEDWTGTCSAQGTRPNGNAWWAMLPFAGVILLLARRRLARVGAAAAVAIALATTAGTGTARADDPDTDAEDIENANERGEAVVSVDREEGELDIVERRTVDAGDGGDPVNRGFGVRLGLAGTIDNAGAAVTLGVRIDVVDWLTLGVDGEYNPWFSIETGETAPGTANLYLTGIGTWGVIGPVEIRTSLHAGVSMLLWDMVGADKYTVGPFLGITPLGVAFRVSRELRITLDPGGFFVSIAQRQGVPLLYEQHRFGVGARFTF